MKNMWAYFFCIVGILSFINIWSDGGVKRASEDVLGSMWASSINKTFEPLLPLFETPAETKARLDQKAEDEKRGRLGLAIFFSVIGAAMLFKKK